MKKKWLVTVDYNLSSLTTSIIVELKEGITPVEWFQTNPRICNKSNFAVNTLLNFWPVEKNRQKTAYINATKERRRKEQEEKENSPFGNESL